MLCDWNLLVRIRGGPVTEVMVINHPIQPKFFFDWSYDLDEEACYLFKLGKNDEQNLLASRNRRSSQPLYMIEKDGSIALSLND